MNSNHHDKGLQILRETVHRKRKELLSISTLNQGPRGNRVQEVFSIFKDIEHIRGQILSEDFFKNNVEIHNTLVKMHNRFIEIPNHKKEVYVDEIASFSFYIMGIVDCLLARHESQSNNSVNKIEIIEKEN